MDTRKRYSKVFEKNYSEMNINRNDFTPTENKKSANEVIKEFLRQKDVAPWFRGTSHLHIQGTDKLFNALRDDGEQKTTHRVRACLSLIGLTPLITSKQIMFLMRLSRGNDLAFLWFLLEMHYKTPKHDPNSYSVNEQLICSAICHLDMVPTLRELDKILPKRFETKRANQKEQKPKALSVKRSNERNRKEFVLPYFAKSPRPVHYGKRLFIEEPNFKVSFPNRSMQNESNRWHAHYQFNPRKRIVHLIIGETIRNIFYNYDAVSIRSRTIEVLCEYHKTARILAVNLELELKLKARNESLKSSKEYKDMDNRNRNIKLLENAVQEQLRAIKEQSNVIKRENATLKTITSDCKVVDFVMGDETLEAGSNRSYEKKNEFSLPDTKNTNVYENMQSERNLKRRNVKKNVEAQMHGDNFEGTKEINDNYNYKCNISDTEAPSERLFTRSTIQKPYQFNYKKIFAPTLKETCSREKCIRKMFLAALDENMSTLSTEDEGDPSLLYDEAIKNCTKNIFDNDVKKYEADNMEEIEAQKSENSRPLSQYPSVGNYNCENYALLDEMLCAAFQYLRKNPKFVWAQLPDAHRMPFLREWIILRFGKEYSPVERARSYRMSYIVFRALDKIDVKYPIPNANQIGKEILPSYSCQSHMRKEVQHLRKKYYRLLDSSFMEQTRIFWFAMRGYICSNGPPRKSFFAYMPSRRQDIHHFRLWKS